jgi:zinc protease
MASGLSSFGGRNSLGLSVTALNPKFFDTLKLADDVLLNFVITDDVLRREKQQMVEHLRARNDKPAQKCMLNLAADIFGSHPYGRDPYGSEDAIAALQASDIESHLYKHLDPSRMVISVVGGVDEKKLLKCLEQTTQQLAQIYKKQKVPVQWPGGVSEITKNKRRFVSLDKAQSHIALAYRGVKVDDPERWTLEVMQSILSGQGGRLFVELRDKASLAYSVSPLRLDGVDPGYFGAYIGCSPEKGTKAIEMMREEFRKLVDNLVEDGEIDRAKRYLLGRHDIAIQRTGHMADLMLFDQLYGLPFDEFESFQKNLEAVSAKRIQKLAKRIFSQPYVLSVVGKSDVTVTD